MKTGGLCQVVQPNRKFVRSGLMKVEICHPHVAATCAPAKRSTSLRRRAGAYEVLLFSDLLIIAKPKGSLDQADSKLQLLSSYEISRLHPVADLAGELDLLRGCVEDYELTCPPLPSRTPAIRTQVGGRSDGGSLHCRVGIGEAQLASRLGEA